MSSIQVTRPDLETPLSSTLLTISDIQEMEINDKKVIAIICPQVSPGSYFPRCVSGSTNAFTQSGITASGSDAELNATLVNILGEPTAHFVLTKESADTYSLKSVGYNFYQPGYDSNETNSLAWISPSDSAEFNITSPIISDTTNIAVNALASNESFLRFASCDNSSYWLCAGADAGDFGYGTATDITSVWYAYELNGYVAEDVYTITATSNNTTYGTVSGSGNYADGDSVTLEAVETATGRFLGWSDGIAEASRTFTAVEDFEIRANFVSIDKGLIPVIRENLISLWTYAKAYFSASTGASHIGVPTNNINATTVADVVTSIGEPNGIATLGQDGKLTTEQMGGSTLSGSAGSSTQPVYLDDGTITACGNSLAVDITGSAAKVGVATVGSSNQPVYMNAGTPTACGFKVETVTQVPANPDHDTIYIIVS
jgi:hypothetical protein